MKQFIFFLILIVAPIFARASKDIYPFEIVAATADLVVIGEIQEVYQFSYTFKVQETLKGKLHKKISVRKFSEWMCDKRFAKHEKGQKLCLFLQKGIMHWQIINGSTGERRIVNDSIDLDGYGSYIRENAPTPYKFSLSEIKAGLRSFFNCFIYISKYEISGEERIFKQMCKDEETFAYKNLSRFSAWLNEQLENYTIQKT